MEPGCCPLSKALDELDRFAPGAPILALGQTVFWDEPMKAGIALGLERLGRDRKFVAGVHDTDYFAKLPTGRRRPGKFLALPHNDTTTKGLWSAAAEFSALFGSETVLTRESLMAAGLKVERLEATKPGFLEEATEAWGWRGIVSLDEHAPITKDVKLHQVFDALHETLMWAIDTSLSAFSNSSRASAEPAAESLRASVCDFADDRRRTLADLYEDILPRVYELVASRPVPMETTRTTRLLTFNRETATRPRFELPGLFADHRTREVACAAYDESLKGGSGFYGLSRFGTGAIPFDLVIPGIGRGTLRLGRKAVVVMTSPPQFLTLKKPLESIEDLAAVIEDKFGKECVLIGKAVTLIGMLAREFVFAFHEGASSYVKHSRKLHQLLTEQGLPFSVYPILRVKYASWDALNVACTWMRLPELLRRPFGSEELCAPSFSRRWREVAEIQAELLRTLGNTRRQIELIELLDRHLGGSWRTVLDEYRGLQVELSAFRTQVEEVRAERLELYQQLRRCQAELRASEAESGAHFRQAIFENEPSAEDLAQRQELQARVSAAHRAVRATREALNGGMRRQHHLSRDPKLASVMERRRLLETEAEMQRLRLIREATLASKGLHNANLRPSAWWFPLVSPDGLWFRETVQTAQYSLEHLQ